MFCSDRSTPALALASLIRYRISIAPIAAYAQHDPAGFQGIIWF